MSKARRPKLITVLALLAAVVPRAALGGDDAKGSQAHIRFGQLMANFSGPSAIVTSSFSIPSFDFDYEIFSNRTRSWVLRTILSYDIKDALMRYAYAGVGRRFYLWSQGMAYDNFDEGVRVTSLPKWRYYAGADFGISQVIMRPLGAVLQANSSMIDFGGNFGVIWQAGKSLGIEAHLGANYGWGFSSVAVAGTTLRMFLGMSYFF